MCIEDSARAAPAAPQLRAWYHLRAARRALARYHNPQAIRHLQACLRVWPADADVLLLAARAARRWLLDQAAEIEIAIGRSVGPQHRHPGGRSQDVQAGPAFIQHWFLFQVHRPVPRHPRQEMLRPLVDPIPSEVAVTDEQRIAQWGWQRLAHESWLSCCSGGRPMIARTPVTYVPCVTNQMLRVPGDFEKGEAEDTADALAVSRAAAPAWSAHFAIDRWQPEPAKR